MDLDFAPRAFTDLLPDALKGYATLIVVAIVGLVGLIGLIILAGVVRFLLRGRKAKDPEQKYLEQDLTEYPDLKTSSGDRQLRAEGVPVRLRLLVVAPAGTASDVDLDELPELL